MKWKVKKMYIIIFYFTIKTFYLIIVTWYFIIMAFYLTFIKIFDLWKLKLWDTAP